MVGTFAPRRKMFFYWARGGIKMDWVSPCGSCGRRSALNDDSQLFEKCCCECDYQRLLEKEEAEENENEYSE